MKMFHISRVSYRLLPLVRTSHEDTLRSEWVVNIVLSLRCLHVLLKFLPLALILGSGLCGPSGRSSHSFLSCTWVTWINFLSLACCVHLQSKPVDRSTLLSLSPLLLPPSKNHQRMELKEVYFGAK